MASLNELQDALINADKAGDAAAARQLADAIHSYKATESAKPAASQIGSSINGIPRQLGLTARYALEGPAQFAQSITEPIRNFVTDPISRMFGGKNGKPLGAAVSSLADKIGLPSPQGANERMVADGTRMGFGAGATFGLGGGLQQLPGYAQQLGAFLTAAPAQQLGSAVGAGLASGASREGGGGALQQGVAGVLGGLGGGMVPGAVSALSTAARGALTPSWSNMQIDAKISQAMATRGIDYTAIPERVKQGLRAELGSSLQAGKQIDPAAVARLADFKATGLTPTRGMVSQDPVQITREMNLAKMAANSGDAELHGLPRLQNQNNTQLIRNLNEGGASTGDAFMASENAIGSIRARDAGLKSATTKLYEAARDLPGGEIPLDRTAVVNGVYSALAKNNKLAYLPKEISDTLDLISQGQVTRNGQTFHVPFDAKALDNLMTDIATAQRGTRDGNVKAALSAARQAIDASELNPVKRQYGGSQLVTEAGGEALKVADAQAQAFMDALNKARASHAGRMNWQESARPIEAVIDGVEPDNFFKKFVLNGTVRDAQTLAKEVPSSGIKEAIMAHLKDKALNSASDEIGKFSQAAYNKALLNLGDRKLAVFFSPEEISQLKTVGRVASYTMNQPVGSAVNNSNSGALVLGRGADFLGTLAKKVPFGQQMVADPLRNINVALSQRQAEKLLPGLLARPENTSFMNGLLAPTLAAGGLLAAPMSP